MGTSAFSLLSLAVALAIAAVSTPAVAATRAPQVPNTASTPFTQMLTAAYNAVAPSKPTTADMPVRVIAPSIGLDAPIQNMGLNAKGELDVPDGSTGYVGWYRDGVVPGFVGSAVFDAHVFAAFQDLRHVPVGGDIYVVTAAGRTLHFVVQDSLVYKLGDLSPHTLFGTRDAKRLNLITCAGQPTSDGSTYTHRLVVFATMVEEGY